MNAQTEHKAHVQNTQPSRKLTRRLSKQTNMLVPITAHYVSTTIYNAYGDRRASMRRSRRIGVVAGAAV